MWAAALDLDVADPVAWSPQSDAGEVKARAATEMPARAGTRTGGAHGCRADDTPASAALQREHHRTVERALEVDGLQRIGLLHRRR